MVSKAASLHQSAREQALPVLEEGRVYNSMTSGGWQEGLTGLSDLQCA